MGFDLGGIGGIIGGITAIGETSANQVGAEMARDWARGMSNTQYQRMVRDLRRAGLNPALAFGGGSAHPSNVSVPPVPHVGGAMASVAAGVSAGKQVAATANELKALAARAKTEETGADYAPELKRAEVSALYGQWYRDKASAELSAQQAKESAARTIATDVNRSLMETELPAARARAIFDQTEYGEVMNQVRRALDLLPSISGSFGSSSRRGRGRGGSWESESRGGSGSIR